MAILEEHPIECKCDTCSFQWCGCYDYPCDQCEDYSEYKRMTNADRIRSMTDEELAEFMFRTFGRPAWCLDNNCPPEESCVQCWLEWLKQESENLNDKAD